MIKRIDKRKTWHKFVKEYAKDMNLQKQQTDYVTKTEKKNVEYVIDFLSQINGDVSAVTQHWERDLIVLALTRDKN